MLFNDERVTIYNI